MASCELSRDSCDCRGPKEASDSGRGDDKFVITMDDRNRVIAMDEEEVGEQEERPGLGLGFGSQENDRRYKINNAWWGQTCIQGKETCSLLFIFLSFCFIVLCFSKK